MAKAPAKPSKPKKRNRFKIVVVLFCVIILLSVALAGAIVYVRNQNAPIKNQALSRLTLQSITVNGNTQYDDAAIIGESGLAVGQSIFSINKATAAKNIENTFPYVADTTIKSPTYNTIVIEIVETEIIGAMYGGGQWLVVGANGKILETMPVESDRPGRYFYLQGATPVGDTTVGAAAMDERSLGIVNTVFAALKDNGIEGVVGIDMRDKTNISFNWKNTLTVTLGNESNLTAEIGLFAKSLPQILERNGGVISGKLDLSSYSDDTATNDKIIYTPKDILEAKKTSDTIASTDSTAADSTTSSAATATTD